MRHRVRVVEPSRFSLLDLMGEAVAGILQRPGRSVLTLLGTVLGIGTFVAIVGLTDTAGGQIGKQFSVLEATQVTVKDLVPGQTREPELSFPSDADARVEALNGVKHAGIYWKVSVSGAVRARPNLDGSGALPIEVFAASPGALAAMAPTIDAGVLYNDFHEKRGERVAIISRTTATQFGISGLEGEPAVFIDGVAYTVVGIIDRAERLSQLMLGVIIPQTTAIKDFGLPGPDDPAAMLIETQIGAAKLIARQAPIALRPDNPRLLSATPPLDPRTLRDAVTSDINSLFLLLAALAVVIGAIGIANTTLVAILERTGEIGLRRALGARPRHIAAQFLTESTTLGTIGGLIGSSIGVLVVITVAIMRDWTTIVEPLSVLLAPVAGGLVGLVAGFYPALRAATIEPTEALQR